MLGRMNSRHAMQRPVLASLHADLQRSERDLRAVQALVLSLLALLLAYAGLLVFQSNWGSLVSILPPLTAACAAMLVAKTATRFLNYNMLVRADDRAQDVVRVTHHALAVVNDLRGRVQYMRAALLEGSRPLAAIRQNAEALQLRYESLYDRDLYRYLSGPTIDLITNLSGSLFGISALAAGLSSSMEGKEHLSVPLAEPTARTKLASAFTSMEDELNSLFSQIQAVRASVEEGATNVSTIGDRDCANI